ncbi:MAG: heme ABC transporter ATP-binding protein [Microbacteriaceae bacterium]
MRVLLNDVSLRIAERDILTEVSFEVQSGQLHALLGPNGAGKSTLLGLMAGDHRPSGGSVRINDVEAHAWQTRDLARMRSMLTQEHAVSFPFMAQQVVQLGRRPWAGTARSDDDDAVVADALLAVEMADAAEQPVPTMSGGERARVALARVLAQQAELVLLDEPTAALDLRHQEHTMQLARSLADEGRAVVVVLHDLNLAAAYADQVTLLDRGRVIASGSPAAVLTAERVSRVYQQPVELLQHGGSPLIVPSRNLTPTSESQA